MKYIHKLLIFLFVGLSSPFLITSCLEDEENTLILEGESNRYVDITNPWDVQQALKIKNSKIINGEDLPNPSSGNYYLSSSISSIKVNSGSVITLPLIYKSSYDIESVYIQVKGADGKYFSVTPTLLPSVTNDIYGYISITMPKNIDDGTFSIRYNVKDKAGRISNIVITVVEITNKVVSCNNASNSGSSGLTFSTLYLGNEGGQVTIEYDTYTIPDRIDIYQGEQWLTGTGDNPNSPIPPMCECKYPLPGFVGKRGILQFHFDPKKGQNITVVVSGCLNGGTAWDWVLTEAPDCQ